MKELIKECHEMAIKKGFYDCPDCEGAGIFHLTINGNGDSDGDETKCAYCKGTGKDPNKNIGELLMLIVSELSQALKAHRKNRFAEYPELPNQKRTIDIEEILNCLSEKDKQLVESTLGYFKQNIKNTFEDKLACAFIRLFDLCGYLKVNINSKEYIDQYLPERGVYKNVGEEFFNVAVSLRPIWKALPNENIEGDLSYILSRLIAFCSVYNIDIEKHIKARIEYDKIVKE
jgi:hypothetical protein